MGLPQSCGDSASRTVAPDRVLILGAGMAGLAAANALGNAGIPAVVLEARGRIGGRLHTVDVGGIPIDLGASWIHNPIGNPLTAFAERAGIGQIPADPTSDAASILYYDAVTGSGSPADLIAAYADFLLFQQTSDQWLARLGDDASIRDGVELFLDNQPLLILPDRRRRSEHFLRFLYEVFDSGRWEDISLFYEVNSPIDAYGGSDFGDFPSGGYGGLARAMASSSDVRLNHTVRRVEIANDSVTVIADDTAGGGAVPVVFRGSHVIVTLPLGVLKQGSVVFDPPLPNSKLDAVARLGMGHFEKVALRFSRPFWQDGLLPRTHLYYVSRSPAFPTELAFFLDYQQLIGAPALVGIAAAEFAEDFATRSPAEIEARVMEILREVYGPTVPAPTDVAVSRWGTDELSRGSYSFLPVGSSPEDMDTLAEPVGERLFFAGEATYKARYGFADGALSSGLREAQRLIRSGTATLSPGPG